MTGDSEHREIDAFDGSLRQPDQRSCGAAVLVLARMLLDDAYADLVVAGVHPSTGQRSAGDLSQRFAAEVLGMHRRVTGPMDASGRLQLPWPRALGTPPWAVARQLSATAGSHLPPTRYSVTPIGRRARDVFDRILEATESGRPVPLFVGNRLLPRHVVLALGSASGRLRCYDPATGRVVPLDRTAFIERRLGLSGWDRPWLAVLPH
ncbi:hypothetical protein [Nocardioides sp.]|uniref:hypothetical protein n=1 Tax=Nocardioides sp. TaxID=35761 RepID=UPI003564F0BC